MSKTFWQTITIAKIEGRGKNESKYYMSDVNPEREHPSEPILFKNRWDLIILAGMILGFCVCPKQTWVEIKARVPSDGTEEETEEVHEHHSH